MTFKDLKLPKELSKKKRLDLYKCWILSQLQKGSDQRVLDLNIDLDRYGLTEKAAFHLAINKMGSDFFNSGSEDPLDFIKDKLIVIMKFTLITDAMEEEIIVAPSKDIVILSEPDYVADPGLVTATIRDRIADMEIKNYEIDSIECEIDRNTEIIIVKDLSLRETIINKSLTGG